MKLSELQKGSFEVVEPDSANLRLSNLPVKEVQIEPAKPEPRVSVLDALKEGGLSAAIQAMKQNKAAYDADTKSGVIEKPVTGTPPLAIPAAALPKVAKLAEAINSNFIGRMGASSAQGAIQGAMSGDDKTIDQRMESGKSGAKTAAVIQAGVEALPVIGKIAGTAARKGGSWLTGIPEDAISNYASRTDDVNALVKQSGGNLDVAADQIREGLQGAVRSKRAGLSKQISDSIKSFEGAPGSVVDSAPIIATLGQAKKGIHPVLGKDALAQIDDMIAAVKKSAQGGKVSVATLNEIKGFLQDRAKGAYMKGGQIFQGSNQASQAAKGGAAVSRKMLNSAAPDVAQANNELSLLHNLESGLNKNLLAPGKSDSALIAAGSGANQRNFRKLEKLGEVSGFPIVEKAKDLASAQYFSSPSLLPIDRTGKSLTRLAAGAGLGALAGPAGIAAGAALASPMTLKAAINTANLVSPALNKAFGWTALMRDNPAAAMYVINLTKGQVDRNNPPPAGVEEFLQDNPNILGEANQSEREPSAVKRRMNKIKNPNLSQ